MRTICSLALLLHAFCPLFAQVAFSHFPADNQLYPRDLASNTAKVRISGVFVPGSADSLLCSIEKSDGLLTAAAFPLSAFANDSFDLYFDIHAGLFHHHFRAALAQNGSTWTVASALNVVAGDVFLVQGQSNAQAVAYNGNANIWQNNYTRCFGSPNPDAYDDRQWRIAEGNGYFSPGAVGQWALRMGHLLQEHVQVPIAIINGADPGKPIEFFQRNDASPADPATNYGRLLTRAREAGVADRIRGILFYQGESDGNRADIHRNLFEALYADWAEDFPGVELYCAVQVREGCGGPSLQLRQYQMDFENYLPNLVSMTANGLPGHDGCHYNVQGYGRLGEKMYKLIAAKLYGTPSGEQLNIRALKAAYTNPTNTQIRLQTDATALSAGTGSAPDFQISGTSSSVIHIGADGGDLLLDLDQPVYNAGAAISYSGHAGDAGNWVLNSDGHGLFSFHRLPIENHTALPNFDIAGIMSGPGNCISLDGTDDCVYIGPVLGSSYTKEAWVNWQGGGLGNNIVSGIANTAFWAPQTGSGYHLCAGHNGAWLQVQDPSPMAPFQWAHVAVTYDADLGQMTLYKNGTIVSQASNVPPHNDPELFIGAYSGGYTFQGKIDEVRIWDYPRSTAEIRGNMCQKLKGSEPGLRSYFRFDQTDGSSALNTANAPAGQLFGIQGKPWQRSGAPIGTKSSYLYHPAERLGVALPSGDSLVLAPFGAPEFAHLYFTEEAPNVLQPGEGHVLVDNSRYFGLFLPKNSLDSFTLTYHYQGNPFANVDEPRLRLHRRANNAQPYWDNVDSIVVDFVQNTMTTRGQRSQEYILAIQQNTVGAQSPPSPLGALYPNPSNGCLYIRGQQATQVTFYDAWGKAQREHARPSTFVDLNGLPNGLYCAKIRWQDGTLTWERVVLHH